MEARRIETFNDAPNRLVVTTEHDIAGAKRFESIVLSYGQACELKGAIEAFISQEKDSAKTLLNRIL